MVAELKKALMGGKLLFFPAAGRKGTKRWFKPGKMITGSPYTSFGLMRKEHAS